MPVSTVTWKLIFVYAHVHVCDSLSHAPGCYVILKPFKMMGTQ